jgi:undecaprenyl-diphosphatase
VLLAAAWVFGVIAHDVVSGAPLTALDVELAQWLHRHATPPLTATMLVITNLHSTVAVSCYAMAAAVYLFSKRRWRALVTVFVCVAGGLTLNVLMKLAFQRARPTFEHPLLTLNTYSFPSGHMAGSTIFYGLCIAWVWARTRRWRWRVPAVLAAALTLALVGLSRMYLGVHYLSDVAAAFAEGVAWMALCLTALHAFWRDSAPDASPPAPVRPLG